jgi:Brp/Blh family beta-carotene 15,15'-monooxygenase
VSLRTVVRHAPETLAFLGVGALAVVWLTVVGSSGSAGIGEGLVVVLAMGVAVFGLPHGALDPWIAHRAGLWQTAIGAVGFHVAYVALAAAVVLLWLWAPGASLAAFLLISAWHFSGDWRDRLPIWARGLAGAALLALPAWRWPDEVSQAFVALSGPSGAVVADGLTALSPWLGVGLAALALAYAGRAPRVSLELGAIAALALLLPPLVYFIVYFCALHSPRHLRLAAAGTSRKDRRRMISVAVLYTALSLLLLAVAWPWLREASGQAWSSDLLRLVFVGLAGLTLPHMLVVMHAERHEIRAP